MLKNLTTGILQRIIKKMQNNISLHIVFQEKNGPYLWMSIDAIKLDVINFICEMLIDIMLLINNEKRSDYD